MGKKAFWVIFVLLYFLPFLFSFINFDSNKYEITDYVIDGEVSDDGDLLIKEYMVIDGSLNGFENEFFYNNPNFNTNEYIKFEQDPIYNPTDITFVKVGSYDGRVVDGNGNLDIFNEVSYADVGDYGVYTKTDVDGGYKVRIYRPIKKDVATIYLEYIINDAVVMHNDVAELYYGFLGNAFRDDIDNVEITINLPKRSTNQLRFWGHGGLQGTIESVDEQKVVAKMSDYFANSDLDIRIIFDKNLIRDDNSLDKTNVNALNDILSIENRRAAEANAIRENIQFKNMVFIGVDILYLLGLMGLAIYVYFKYDREYDSNFRHKYNREFINDYGLEVIDYLMNKSITPNAMSAVIMNLIYKKNISYVVLDKDEYMYTLDNEDNLSESEKNLIKFLFEDIGDGKHFSTKDLQKYAKSSATCDKFNANYNNWKNIVIANAKEQNFYEEHGGIKIVGIVYGIIGVIVWFASMNNVVTTTLFDWLIVPCIAFVIYVLAFKRRTKKGNEHYVRWKAFKNFLEDFGNFSIKELPEIELWEKYLVYAVLFGIADKVQKVMNVKIKEFSNDVVLDSDLLVYNNFYHMSYVVNSSVNSAISAASRASASKAISTSSSGGGFGGGFSSGGGFGGGGRGGGGF